MSEERKITAAKERLEQASEMISRLRVAIRQQKKVSDEELYAIQLAIDIAHDALDGFIPDPARDEKREE